jgi:hypothetical protein
VRFTPILVFFVPYLCALQGPKCQFVPGTKLHAKTFLLKGTKYVRLTISCKNYSGERGLLDEIFDWGGAISMMKILI